MQNASGQRLRVFSWDGKSPVSSPRERVRKTLSKAPSLIKPSFFFSSQTFVFIDLFYFAAITKKVENHGQIRGCVFYSLLGNLKAIFIEQLPVFLSLS